jgi:hypothetical protein
MATATSVDDLGSGAHACLTFSDDEERLDIAAGFVQIGLSQSHKVIYLTDPVDLVGAHAVPSLQVVVADGES